MSQVGNLSTFAGGSLDINGLDASGILSLELLAEDVLTQGTITTNLKATQNSDGTVNTGTIKSEQLESGSSYFINEGSLNTQQLRIEAEGSIYNQFGGRIIGDQVTLISTDASIINGSRSDKTQRPQTLTGVAINAYLPATHKYGVYHDSLTESGSVRTELSAKISANTILISAKRFENINPYHLTKPETVSWQGGIPLNVNTSRRVSVIAEQSLQIQATEYALNASVVLGQNQAGRFIINTPALMNQRYRAEAVLAEFGHATFSDVSDGLGIQNITDKTSYGSLAGVSEINVETYLSAYSPPGVIYSFGDFMFSDGIEDNTTDASFINQFSFLEVFGEAHFHGTDFHSIGLIMAGRPAFGFEPVRCAAYGCSAAEYTSLIEYETLTSFAGKVYGLNTDLSITTTNQLDDSARQIIVDALVADLTANAARDYTIQEEHPELGASLTVRHYNYDSVGMA